MFARHGFMLLLSAVLVVAAGCSNKDKDKDDPAKDGDKVLSGRVVNQPGGGPGVERWRFQPKGEPDRYLRLTRTQMQQAVSPEAEEIKLDQWAGKKIRVKHQQADNTWVWGAEVLP
jgi:hypothetical protein